MKTVGEKAVTILTRICGETDGRTRNKKCSEIEIPRASSQVENFQKISLMSDENCRRKGGYKIDRQTRNQILVRNFLKCSEMSERKNNLGNGTEYSLGLNGLM
uniref:Uncharacterized protein n=1 Tax=Cacopsylla melanoneura TaxID=428564 RepID=A0A8D8XG83_9HEMI